MKFKIHMLRVAPWSCFQGSAATVVRGGCVPDRRSFCLCGTSADQGTLSPLIVAIPPRLSLPFKNPNRSLVHLLVEWLLPHPHWTGSSLRARGKLISFDFSTLPYPQRRTGFLRRGHWNCSIKMSSGGLSLCMPWTWPQNLFVNQLVFCGVHLLGAHGSSKGHYLPFFQAHLSPLMFCWHLMPWPHGLASLASLLLAFTHLRCPAPWHPPTSTSVQLNPVQTSRAE